MHQSKLLAVLLVLFTLGFYAQEAPLLNKYANYFEHKQETIYTQLNKSNVLANENLWFQSYIYFNQESAPYASTTNVYYNVYDASGHLVDQKVFNAKDGTVTGHIAIDDKYATGVYYLKTTTNWMRNFNVDNSDLKTFVVNAETTASEQSTTGVDDLTITPEGGSLIANTYNTIGIRIGNKLDFKKTRAVMKNSNGETVGFASINEHGLGKFGVTLAKNEDYTVSVLHDGKEISSQTIRGIKPNGVNLTLNNKADKVLLTFRTNPATLKTLVGKTYSLYFHRDGEINVAYIDFNENVLQYTIPLSRSDLMSGMNILTLLDEKHTPVLERMLFNPIDAKVGQLGTVAVKRHRDSTTLTIQTNVRAGADNNFSASILPADTKSANFEDNIVTKLLLSPYLTSALDGYGNHLGDLGKKAMYDLDLLLISEGPSKQSWNDIIYRPQGIVHPFDTGFQIKGKLNKTKYDKTNTLELISPINGLTIKSRLAKGNLFAFDNLYLNKDSAINFILRNSRNKTLKVHPYYNFFPKPIVDSLDVKVKSETLTIPEISQVQNLEHFIVDENTVELEEISLEVKKVKKPRNKPTGFHDSDKVDIPESANQFQLVTDFIAQHGFDVSNSGGNVTILSRRARSTSRISPLVFLDHAPINSNLQQITNMRLFQVEEIFISKTGSGLGAGAAGGAISIFTKLDSGSLRQSFYKTFEIAFGFDAQKAFEAPFYTSTDSENYNFYGVIDWKPTLKADKDGLISIKIPNNKKEVRLSINGMDEDGNLYHLTKTVTLE